MMLLESSNLMILFKREREISEWLSAATVPRCSTANLKWFVFVGQNYDSC